MITLFDPSAPGAAGPISAISAAGDPTAAGESSWLLTQAVHALRLVVADAHLRARDDAQRTDRASIEFWYALGRAQGYREAAAILRGWNHPGQHEAVFEHLAQRGRQAQTDAERHARSDAEQRPRAAFHLARSWALRWVMTQVGELGAHASQLS
jgi:hypothetical protein